MSAICSFYWLLGFSLVRFYLNSKISDSIPEKVCNVGALPQIPKFFFVLPQKRIQKKSRLSPLRTKNWRLTAKIF
jgi:hypothetical protein